MPSPVIINELKRDRDQLLAEAVYRYRPVNLSNEVEAQRIAEQEQERALSVTLGRRACVVILSANLKDSPGRSVDWLKEIRRTGFK